MMLVMMMKIVMILLTSINIINTNAIIYWRQNFGDLADRLWKMSDHFSWEGLMGVADLWSLIGQEGVDITRGRGGWCL